MLLLLKLLLLKLLLLMVGGRRKGRLDLLVLVNAPVPKSLPPSAKRGRGYL